MMTSASNQNANLKGGSTKYTKAKIACSHICFGWKTSSKKLLKMTWKTANMWNRAWKRIAKEKMTYSIAKSVFKKVTLSKLIAR